MNQNLTIWKSGRESLSWMLRSCTPEQLNKTPAGFSNNIAWNLGHIIAVQQSLVYRRTGMEGLLPKRLYDLYMPGTRPGAPLHAADLEELKSLLFSTIGQTEADYASGAFGPFRALTTSRGFGLNSLEDAIAFNNFHEGLHIGSVMSLLKFV